jgi:hypothetical protein
MQLSEILRTGVRTSFVFAAALCLCAQEQTAPPADARPKETLGLPPRVAPSEYQAQAKAGAVTLAADFVRHSVPTPQGTLNTEDYVVVELGLYGAPDARIQISLDDFSLRINGKKTALRCQPFGMVLASLKDPEWVPPEPVAQKSKTSLNTGGGGGGQNDPGSPPPVVHVPIEVKRALDQRVQKAALPLGDRALPQAGLIFFQYRSNTKNIESIDLIYSGPAGKATLALRP